MEITANASTDTGVPQQQQVQGSDWEKTARERKLRHAACGARYRGKEELLAHLRGERISIHEAVRAFCYECNGYYASGREDCKTPSCALYPFNPAGTRPGRRQLSDQERQALRERFLANLVRAGLR